MTHRVTSVTWNLCRDTLHNVKNDSYKKKVYVYTRWHTRCSSIFIKVLLIDWGTLGHDISEAGWIFFYKMMKYSLNHTCKKKQVFSSASESVARRLRKFAFLAGPQHTWACETECILSWKKYIFSGSQDVYLDFCLFKILFMPRRLAASGWRLELGDCSNRQILKY